MEAYGASMKRYKNYTGILASLQETGRPTAEDQPRRDDNTVHYNQTT